MRLINCLLVYLLLPTTSLFAQETQFFYTYNELSSVYYKPFKDSIKTKWKCPVVFKDKKAQREYEKSWDKRSDYFIKAIEDNDYIRDNTVYPYIEKIVQEIVQSNKDLISVSPKILIDRTDVPNAYSFGEHIIAINTGLILRSHSREELALYLAHELAHDILKHSDNSMKKKAELLTSDDYEESMKDVLSSKYERYSKLKKIFEGYTFDRSRHSRYSEQEADSLAIILLEKSRISFDASCFLNLDTIDNQYKNELSQSVKQHFQSMNLEVNDNWLAKRKKGLSNSTYTFTDTSGLKDSLKTHPDCAERYAQNLGRNSKEIIRTKIPSSVMNACFNIAFYNLFFNKQLCHSMYKLLQENELSHNTEKDYLMFSHIMNSLLYSVRQMDRFNALKIQKKKDVGSSYFELQNLLEQIPEADLSGYCKILNEKSKLFSNKEQLAVLEYFRLLHSEPQHEKTEKLTLFIKKFKSDYPNSIYKELIN